MKITRLGLGALGLVLAFGTTGHAAPYTAEYVFGDSLSDNGNLAEVYFKQNYPNPPSYRDSFTNGPVANEVLAGALGVPLNPSLWVTNFQDTNNLFGGASYVPGTNYAVAGATASAQAPGGPAAINLPQQVGAYTVRSGGVADPAALYVVEIGGNDVRNAARQGIITGITTVTAAGTASITTGVQTELGAIQSLASLGARNFLVVNVPNVGVIPEFTQGNPTLAAAATAYTQQYDAQLASGLSSLSLPSGTRLTPFDLYGYNTGLIANAAALGFTNSTDPCFTATPLLATTTPQCGPGGANISQFFYWDAIHPSGRVQGLWALGFESAIGVSSATGVPEPASIAVLGLGLAGLVGLGRRRVSVAR